MSGGTKTHEERRSLRNVTPIHLLVLVPESTSTPQSGALVPHVQVTKIASKWFSPLPASSLHAFLRIKHVKHHCLPMLRAVQRIP